MAITQAQVDQWFAANPNATAQQVADAVEAVGGLTPELSSILATKYETSPEVVSQQYQTLTAPTYFEQRPDVAAAYTPTSGFGTGLTPEQFANAHYLMYGAKEGATAPTVTGATIVPDYKGKYYDLESLRKVATQLAGVADPSRISGGAFGTDKATIGFDYNAMSSALGTDKLTAYDLVLMDAARGLLDKGVTDLSQLTVGDVKGNKDVYAEVDGIGDYTGRYYWNEYNGGDGPAQRFLTPEEAKNVIPANSANDQPAIAENIVTGQGVYLGDKLISPNTGIGLGRTSAGEGITNYGLDFIDGKPSFGTSGEGTSFFDTGIGQFALMTAAMMGAPYLSSAIGGVTGLTGANLAAATGATIGGTSAALTGQDPLKGALVGGAGGYAGATLGGATSPTGTGVDLGTATGADLDLFYDMGPAQTGGVNLGTATTGSTTGGTMLDYSMPTARGGLGLQGTAALDGTLSSGLAAPAGGSLGGGLGLTASTAGNLGYMGGGQGLTANAIGGGTLSSGGVNTGLFTPDNLYNSSIGTGGTGGTGGGTGKKITASDVIKTLPLVNTVATLVGGGGDTGGGGPTGTTGFGIVPMPESWKPPTYSQSTQAPIDLNSIFTNQNLLTGTQWEGLPNQRNLTFNDIFAAGQQSTPMGTPVNLNNIVSAILGQSATS